MAAPLGRLHLVTDVRRDRDSAGDLVRCARRGFCVEGEDRDGRAFLCESLRDREADPARAAGDERGLALEPPHSRVAARKRPKRSSAGSSTVRSAA